MIARIARFVLLGRQRATPLSRRRLTRSAVARHPLSRDGREPTPLCGFAPPVTAAGSPQSGEPGAGRAESEFGDLLSCPLRPGHRGRLSVWAAGASSPPVTRQPRRDDEVQLDDGQRDHTGRSADQADQRGQRVESLGHQDPVPEGAEPRVRLPRYLPGGGTELIGQPSNSPWTLDTHRGTFRRPASWSPRPRTGNPLVGSPSGPPPGG